MTVRHFAYSRSIRVCLILGLPISFSLVRAQAVQVNAIEGQNLWNDYPQNVDKPISRWNGSTLVVRVIETSNSCEVLDEAGAHFALEGSKLHLTYHMKAKALPASRPDLPPLPGAVIPILLEFQIKGLASRPSMIEVSRSDSRDKEIPSDAATTVKP